MWHIQDGACRPGAEAEAPQTEGVGGGAIASKAEEGGLDRSTYLGMLRAALAHVAPAAALTTVWAWIKVSKTLLNCAVRGL